VGALVGFVLLVGLADSLNPSTIVPGLYLAGGRSGARRVWAFTAGFLALNFAAGVLIALGPGQLLFVLVPRPGHTARHVVESAAGIALLATAVTVWLVRARLAERDTRLFTGRRGWPAGLGAAIAAVELPTAAPYFVVIAAIVSSKASLAGQVGLIALFNLAFVAPLLLILAILVAVGERADEPLARTAAWLRRRWPALLASILAAAGALLTAVGIAGLA
jgi:cytochrome c biogenesis protein CcdA